ncbi:potassium channel family protein [Nocardia uniformis]|uniref:Potassium channel family protein n=1 Tax=Nocardia uniformis TaxID=53432 RepID=A0A849C964_9NOCA|nr:potassium channel family protein [Nocardia uniformis]NNH72910.1 potassium channel family protein [Nocardia uniformis]
MPTPTSPSATAETSVSADLSRLTKWERATDYPLTTLAAVFLIAYSWHVLDTGASPRLDTWLTIVDVAVWVVFAADFIIRCWLSPHRWDFVRTHPVDLLIVLLPPFRPLRLLRAAMIVLNTLNRHTRTRARMSVFVGGASVLILYLCSLAMFDAEYGAEDGNVQNFGDAMWWSLVSVTTVGYGDYYPVTVGGRLVALVLMTFGIGLISFAIGTTTSWVIDQLKSVEETTDRTDREVGVLLDEITALRDELASLRTEISTTRGRVVTAE